MLVVQRITIRWTKASRGGAAAERRNALPAALPLPSLAGATVGYLLHDVQFLEWENFACRENVAESDALTHVRLEPVILRVTKAHVAVRFIWSRRHCGAPKRDAHDLFRLEPGDWGRFVCNGRFGADSSAGRAWEYHMSVFNIASVEDYDRMVFIHYPPKAEAARLAVLS